MSKDDLSLYSVNPATGKYTGYTAAEDYNPLGLNRKAKASSCAALRTEKEPYTRKICLDTCTISPGKMC